MKTEESVFDSVDEEADARRYAEAVADIAAGRLVPNAEVLAWLATWGAPDEAPPPESWFK